MLQPGEPSLAYGTLIEGQLSAVHCSGVYGGDSELAPEQRPRLRIMINYANGDETLWGNFSELVQGQPGPGDDYVPWQIQLVSDHVMRILHLYGYMYMYIHVLKKIKIHVAPNRLCVC